jgi:integrase
MTGHIQRRGARSWRLKFDIGTDPLTGKRRIRYHAFKGTKREAALELARLVSANAAGEYVDPSRETVGGFLDRWGRDWASTNVSPKTLETYRHHLKYVRRNLGSARLQQLRPVHLMELYAKLLREGRRDGHGLSARTVCHVHRILHRALGHAVQWGLVQQNISESVSPPPVASTELSVLDAAQAKALLQTLRGRSIYPLASLALATGMRRGELCALRWQDVDLDLAKLRVEQSLEQTSAGLRFKAPKTRHGRRSIALPLSAVSELRAHWKAQQEQRLALGLGRSSPDGLVFATWDGKARSPNALTKEWTLAVKAAGMPDVTLHSLRHTHASHLIAAGLDVLTVSRRLGHGSPNITLSVYGHMFPNTDDRAAQIMEATFSGS